METWTRCSRPSPTRRGGSSSRSWPSATGRRCSSCACGSSRGTASTSRGRRSRSTSTCSRAPGLVERAPRRALPPPHPRPRPLRAAWDEWFRPLVHPGDPIRGVIMRINLASIFVDDQVKALAFYTDVLGFEKKTDLPAGEARWLTVVSPEDPDGVELRARARRSSGASGRSSGRSSPTASRSRRSRSATSSPSTPASPPRASSSPSRRRRWGRSTTAVFDDTCGNLIQIASMASA